MIQLTKKITITLVFSLLLNNVQAEDNCEIGKCVTCSINEQSEKVCDDCFKSVATPQGGCEGTSTNIENCLITAYEDEELSCRVCNIGYHLELDSNFKFTACYKTAETPNCFSEQKIEGIPTFCQACKNGFAPARQDGKCPETIDLIPNCLGVSLVDGVNPSCQICEAGYFLNSDGECQKRETLIEKNCNDGTGDEEEQKDGVPYCRSCNTVDNYFAIDARKNPGNGLTQLCAKYSSLVQFGTHLFFVLLSWGMRGIYE